MRFPAAFIVVFSVLQAAAALRWSEQYVGFNLNENQYAQHPLDYSGNWENHTYHPSPQNWRFPFYTLFLDKFANGDPTNDDINGTVFEHDTLQTQLRHGGDVQGLIDSLDYIQGMGIKALYISGSPMINQPWGADGYSPLDLTLLDQHFGNIQTWRNMVDEIHKRGMYVILDNTMSTMGDLVSFKGYENTSTPFLLKEHVAEWRNPNRRYLDFDIGNEYNTTCDYPRFWLDTGYPVGEDVTSSMKGCFNSDFDQYGDTEAFGVFPDWRRQLSKFASAQDRLREWVPSVQQRISHFSCITIKMLDIDGYRLDKATQITVDALGDFAESMRACAREVGKENFFIPGEITGGNTFGSIYLGRGRQPNMLPPNLTAAVLTTSSSNSSLFIRDVGKNALDSAAFHYSIYRSMTRFLGMDGSLLASYDTPLDWVDAWNDMLLTNDYVNPNTNLFDPRHMYGVSNQDVFRWPSIKNGTNKWLLGNFITTLLLPGIPLLLWGEEQAFYVLDNTAKNYVFGRQAMSSALAWEVHGCYQTGSAQYYDWDNIVGDATYGCIDPWNSLDHRDASHPIRNTIKAMYQMRQNYPVLNDGMFLQALSKQTQNIYLPGSSGTPTEIGIWSRFRGQFSAVQNLSKAGGQGDQSLWLVYYNGNVTKNFEFDCSDPSGNNSLVAPYAAGTVVKNLFFPYEEYTLANGSVKLGLEGSPEFNGCLHNLTMQAWGFKAFVRKAAFVKDGPMITKFLPGHDFRVISSVTADKSEDIPIELHFSAEMDCNKLASSLSFSSTTENGQQAQLKNSSVTCSAIPLTLLTSWQGSIPTVWTFKAQITNVYNGVHSISVNNATSINGTFTNARDTFLFRTGQKDNPVIFPRSANYTLELLHQKDDGTLYVSHKAAGADSWRYTLDWTHYSDWIPYTGGNSTLEPVVWSGTSAQAWKGHHVILQYHNKLSGSSDYYQHGDLDQTQTTRRFPHLFAEGPFNQYGYDAGLANVFRLDSAGTWKYDFVTEWPAVMQINVWGVNPDKQPDQSFVFGDADGDSVLDRSPPSALAPTLINITKAPDYPYIAWEIVVHDATLKFDVVAIGNQHVQIAIFVISWITPILTSFIAIWAYVRFFYQIKINRVGINYKMTGLWAQTTDYWAPGRNQRKEKDIEFDSSSTAIGMHSRNVSTNILVGEVGNEKRRTVLIGTIEYDIEDWNIKIKIGGLGVMAQLMGKALTFQDIVWVVPCVGGVTYPVDTPAEPMHITILGKPYEVKVQYHKLRNITYVLLDAPIFRTQTKAEPYPARMDDLDSAVYYSSWNQCIAQAIRRFPVELYHINDYHGAAAPLHLLPQTIPICLSLHNAEFQGLWPLRNTREFQEVCSVFNLPPNVVRQYIQFGDVFNLLHAGSSYLRLHQKGFGAVGVSKKYGSRAHARYPIFWGLEGIGQLPNPDPSDNEAWDPNAVDKEPMKIDEGFEDERPVLKRQAQEWAGLDFDTEADLLVFVGRWSMQKGIDLIADVMPAILEENPHVQLICIGPVIDLYGKFAALKLDVMMRKYPGRVYSKPEFTQLPPFIFSGAEFALIPSRDEPFGLVAVEFGRKGALGIGARVGGLGQMPGWWFTVESTTTSHLLAQFRKAIKAALSSNIETRRTMRATSAKQRFPVAEWIQSLKKLQSTSIDLHWRENIKSILPRPQSSLSLVKGVIPATSPGFSRPASISRPNSRTSSWYGTKSKQIFSIKAEADDTDLDEDSAASVSSPTILEQTSDQIRVKAAELMAGRNRPNFIKIPQRSVSYQAPDITVHNLPVPVKSRLQHYKKNYLSKKQASHTLDLATILDGGKKFELQKIDPDFTDDRAEYFNAFEKSLDKLNGHNSTDGLCIEEYLIKSERKWYGNFKSAKLGRYEKHPATTSVSSLTEVDESVGDGTTTEGTLVSPRNESRFGAETPPIHNVVENSKKTMDMSYWGLGADFKAPTGLKLFMQLKVGEWPVYTIIMALGQIIASSSYQITLISGTVGQTPEKLYVVASIYLATSICWWIMYRTMKSIYVLSVPFIFYGLAFLLLGTAPFATSINMRGWIQNVATGMYAVASSSGSIFFSLNFGDEGGSPIKTWMYRACVIQGTQQIYICVLWAWGSYLTKTTSNSLDPHTITTSSTVLAGIGIPIGILFFGVAYMMWAGLPPYYHQKPGHVPSFYFSLFRRKIVVWFFLVVIIQNYFLSALTGRNWAFLWSSNHASIWQVALLVILFFIVVWAIIIYGFSQLSKSHSWILPLAAIGLGAPRWAQILWSCSGIGAYVPWAGSAVGSALIGRALWLWLGVLDALQGVGFGMLLLQTLTRVHIAYTLVVAQVLGSIATILARATAPDKVGPGGMFPDFTRGAFPGLMQPWFWVGLILQLSICVGFFAFFRKEQLNKP